MKRGLAVVLAGLLAGCATTKTPVDVPRGGEPVELAAVPFYPQKRYQCGPAALATALGASGLAVTPDALVPDMYLPGRRGSLQAELVAAARRYERVAVPIGADAEHVVDELRGGRPVLVLLNLGFSWLPVWHYAVVVGYEPADAVFILRSGTQARARMRAAEFERTWAYSGRWAVVVAALDAPPPDAAPSAWLAAVAPFESLGRLDLAEQGYVAATTRWPQSALAWTALGNVKARRAQWREAIAAYGNALALQDEAVTRNNRANALGELQCRRLAEADLDRAALLDDGGPYAAALARTRASLPLRDGCPAEIVETLGSDH